MAAKIVPSEDSTRVENAKFVTSQGKREVSPCLQTFRNCMEARGDLVVFRRLQDANQRQEVVI